MNSTIRLEQSIKAMIAVFQKDLGPYSIAELRSKVKRKQKADFREGYFRGAFWCLIDASQIKWTKERKLKAYAKIGDLT